MLFYSFVIIFLMMLIIILINYNNYPQNLMKKKEKIVVDIFIYFQESLMLSVRLFRLSKFVDYFIIILSNTTFSGVNLEISFSPFESFIHNYSNKIIFYNISNPHSCYTTWCREKYQRNAAYNAIKTLNINNDSIIIVSDVDEIPTDEAMRYIYNNPPQSIYMLSGYMYYYNYKHKLNEIWPGVVILKASELDDDVDRYRSLRYDLMKTHSIPVFPSLSHCSYCYREISSIQSKLSSFSHSEFNKPPYTKREYIIKCIKEHRDFIHRNIIHVIDYDEDLLPLPDDERFTFLKEEYNFV